MGSDTQLAEAGQGDLSLWSKFVGSSLLAQLQVFMSSGYDLHHPG